MNISTGPLDIKIKHLSDYNLSYVKRFLKTHKFWNVCKKGVNPNYIKGYFELNLKDSSDEYLIQIYDGNKVIGFVILFIKEPSTQDFGRIGEVMIICAKSKLSRIGSALLRYTEIFARDKLNCSHMVLCSLNEPFGFYKKMGYKIMDEDYCWELRKKHEDIYKYFDDEEEFKEYFDKDNMSILKDSTCPYNSLDGCIYMYKEL